MYYINQNFIPDLRYTMIYNGTLCCGILHVCAFVFWPLIIRISIGTIIVRFCRHSHSSCMPVCKLGGAWRTYSLWRTLWSSHIWLAPREYLVQGLVSLGWSSAPHQWRSIHDHLVMGFLASAPELASRCTFDIRLSWCVVSSCLSSVACFHFSLVSGRTDGTSND